MVANTIPASFFVNVNPGVIGAGGTGLSLVGLILTRNTRVPIGTVLSMSSAAAALAYFGAGAQEVSLAETYFDGFDNSTIKPAALLFSQYTGAGAVAAYLRGGNAGALGLAAIQAITSGTITLTVDGTAHTSGAINLSAATSFSNAASLIQTALAASDATATACTISTTTLTVGGTVTGTFAVGQTVTGAGVTAGTVITALGSGTGGAGTYTINTSQTVSSSTAMTGGPVGVTYDSISGGFVITSGMIGAASTITFATGSLSATLLLTAATGAVLSQGAGVATPSSAMAAIAAQSINFATFMTTWEPTVADKTSFAGWNSAQNDQFLYVGWSTDITLTTTVPATASAEYAIQQAAYGGFLSVYAPTNGANAAAFVCGAIASINFNAANGRTDLAYLTQSGLSPDVTSGQTAANLIANGSNFYGITGTAAQTYDFLYPGSVTGPFAWADSYADQIWLNSALQLAALGLLTSVGSLPYNAAGVALIRAALADPIQGALSFGAIRAGVTLSNAQAAEVNAAAGLIVAPTIQNVGWYLLVTLPSSQVRGERGSPTITLFYTDGQGVQSITLASLEVS